MHVAAGHVQGQHRPGVWPGGHIRPRWLGGSRQRRQAGFPRIRWPQESRYKAPSNTGRSSWPTLSAQPRHEAARRPWRVSSSSVKTKIRAESTGREALRRLFRVAELRGYSATRRNSSNPARLRPLPPSSPLPPLLLPYLLLAYSAVSLLPLPHFPTRDWKTIEIDMRVTEVRQRASLRL